jgi:hypothetical protein
MYFTSQVILKDYRIETPQVLHGVKAVKLSVADLEKQRKAMNISRNIAVYMVKEVEETSLSGNIVSIG